MTEHLFKLKKDGKTVGYLKISGKIWWKTNRSWIEIDPQEGCSEFFEDDNGWDTAHPFVTKDKNGKDVFADDEVWFHWKGKKTKGKIIKEGFFWKYESAEKYSRTLCKFDIAHIELIEDKDNDNS